MPSEGGGPVVAARADIAQPSLPTYPYATSPDIIRSNQKDLLVASQLHTSLTEILRNAFGSRLSQTLSTEIETLTSLLYFSLTTLIGNRTLGEEYTDIHQVESDDSLQRLPSIGRRAGYIATSILLPYAAAKILPTLRARIRTRLENSLSRDSDGKSPSSRLKAYLLTHLGSIFSAAPVYALTLGLFYFNGSFYHLSKRLLRLRYVFSRKLSNFEEEQRSGYEALGILLVVQTAVQAFMHIQSLARPTVTAEKPDSGLLYGRTSTQEGDAQLQGEADVTYASLPDSRSRAARATYTPLVKVDEARYNLSDSSKLAWLEPKQQRETLVVLESCISKAGSWMHTPMEVCLSCNKIVLQNTLAFVLDRIPGVEVRGKSTGNRFRSFPVLLRADASPTRIENSASNLSIRLSLPKRFIPTLANCFLWSSSRRALLLSAHFQELKRLEVHQSSIFELHQSRYSSFSKPKITDQRFEVYRTLHTILSSMNNMANTVNETRGSNAILDVMAKDVKDPIDELLMSQGLTVAATDHAKTFPFLSLPIELRNVVYKMHLLMEGPVKIAGAAPQYEGNVAWAIAEATEDRPKRSKILQLELLQIFLVSKTVYHEATRIYFGLNRFYFRETSDVLRMKCLSPDLRRTISKVTLRVHGKKQVEGIKFMATWMGLRDLTVVVPFEKFLGYIGSRAPPRAFSGMQALRRHRGLEHFKIEILPHSWWSVASCQNRESQLTAFFAVLLRPRSSVFKAKIEKMDYREKLHRSVVGKANVTTRKERKLLGTELSEM